jgi:hypothetical protein
MKRLCALVLVLLVGMVGAFAPVNAQAEVRLAALRVGLWPEYDQPSLLVIYWGELDPATPISLRMPARIVAPHVVAAQASPVGNVVEASYEANVEGEWRVITFEANGPQFQMEYYDTLNRDGTQRSPAFVWAGDYAVDAFSVEFQQPPGANDVTISPALSSAEVGPQDGLIYARGEFGAVAAGQAFTVTMGYTRSQDDLTVASLSGTTQVQPVDSSAASPAAAASGGIDVVLLVVVAVVFFLLGAAAMRVAINLQDLNRQDRGRKSRRR